MNKLNIIKQKQVIAALVEGNSIRATVRMTGVAKNTVVKLLADIGKACSDYQDKVFRNLPCKRIHVMRYGHSATRKKRTYQKISRDNSATATCGHGQHYALILNSFQAGILASPLCQCS